MDIDDLQRNLEATLEDLGQAHKEKERLKTKLNDAQD